jgi:hypothetical protein
MAGLDPAIHGASPNIPQTSVDHRVQPDGDVWRDRLSPFAPIVHGLNPGIDRVIFWMLSEQPALPANIRAYFRVG